MDFHLSNRTCILYVSEADLVAGDEFKRRLVRFRNVSTTEREKEKLSIDICLFHASENILLLFLNSSGIELKLSTVAETSVLPRICFQAAHT